MNADFQISYTLDVLCYINGMLNTDKKKLYDEDMERFVPMLGTVSDKHLQKLQKMNEKKPGFILHIVAMLIDHHHLHHWRTTDLFNKFKSLTGDFKKTKHFKSADPALKSFLTGDFNKSMTYIKVIALDLERLGFKNFWLEEKLPVLKARISEYERCLDFFDIESHLNHWSVSQAPVSLQQWYVLSFGGDDLQLLLNQFYVISPVVAAADLFEKLVVFTLRRQDYKSLLRKFSPNPQLKTEFKGHPQRRKYKKMHNYMAACLRFALSVYLLELIPSVEQRELAQAYPLAEDILSQLRENKKETDVSVHSHLTQILQNFAKS